jgi:hypothetical protein
MSVPLAEAPQKLRGAALFRHSVNKVQQARILTNQVRGESFHRIPVDSPLASVWGVVYVVFGEIVMVEMPLKRETETERSIRRERRTGTQTYSRHSRHTDTQTHRQQRQRNRHRHRHTHIRRQTNRDFCKNQKTTASPEAEAETNKALPPPQKVLWTVLVDLSRSSFGDQNACGFGPLDYISLVIDTFFVADIILHLCVFGAVGEMGENILDHRECVIRYLKSRIWIDLPSSFPVFWWVCGGKRMQVPTVGKTFPSKLSPPRAIFILGDPCSDSGFRHVHYARFLRMVRPAARKASCEERVA